VNVVSSPPIRILVLCTGNSCRSIMAEALFRQLGGERITVESAGSVPAGAVNPLTERVLDEAGIDHAWARSKSMTEFLDREFDHVLTVCDDAAEACPVFPGPAVRTHWSIPDPALAPGTIEERLPIYRSTLADLRGRITAFLATLEA
jgi:arsenate reductase (thioredoxin)